MEEKKQPLENPPNLMDAKCANIFSDIAYVPERKYCHQIRIQPIVLEVFLKPTFVV